jgi:pimeloyl-ACP methyl ester carboxylesterase
VTWALIDIGGYRLSACVHRPPDHRPDHPPDRVNATGVWFDGTKTRLASRSCGGSTAAVVLVSGMAGDGREWDAVVTELDGCTTTVAYARAGCGGSGPLPAALARTPRPMSWAAAQLRTLLDAAAVLPPFVLVGHSLGGLIVEAYAARWPAEVAGLVLVDASDPAVQLALLDHDTVEVEGEEDGGGMLVDWSASLDERAAFTLPRVPAVVVTSTVRRWLRPEDAELYRPFGTAEVREAWMQRQRAWASRTGATHLVAHDAGHAVHEDAPALVALAIRAVLDHTPIAAATAHAAGAHLLT